MRQGYITTVIVTTLLVLATLYVVRTVKQRVA